MSTLKNDHRRIARNAHWGWLLPILVLAPLSLAAKGCSNDGVVGDDCPTAADCNGSAGTAGTAGTAGSSNQAGSGNSSSKACGGLLGLPCGKGEFCSFPADAMCGVADQTGTCRALPQACDLIYAPVCGCDGMTYGNECAANIAGVSVASQGECGSEPNPGDGTCGGLLGATCAKGEYCNFAPEAKCGSGDQTGKCQAKPDACDDIYDPVCGCDGMTYSNGCEAAGAGVSVAAQGECDGNPGGGTCGGKTGLTCDANQYCNYPPEASCGRFDATGTCADILQGGCLTIYDPVCGCDGMTYGNACETTLAGVSIDHEGECKGTGAVCGGFIGTQCDAGQYCDYPPEMACGNADGSGVCKDIPELCTAQADPVCGCDGETYGNACLAASNGVSVLNKGACK